MTELASQTRLRVKTLLANALLFALAGLTIGLATHANWLALTDEITTLRRNLTVGIPVKGLILNGIPVLLWAAIPLALLIDRLRVPILRRRSTYTAWLVLLLAVAILLTVPWLLLGAPEPRRGDPFTVKAALVIAAILVGAGLLAAIDAFRTTRAPAEQQGCLAAAQYLGYFASPLLTAVIAPATSATNDALPVLAIYFSSLMLVLIAVVVWSQSEPATARERTVDGGGSFLQAFHEMLRFLRAPDTRLFLAGIVLAMMIGVLADVVRNGWTTPLVKGTAPMDHDRWQDMVRLLGRFDNAASVFGALLAAVAAWKTGPFGLLKLAGAGYLLLAVAEGFMAMTGNLWYPFVVVGGVLNHVVTSFGWICLIAAIGRFVCAPDVALKFQICLLVSAVYNLVFYSPVTGWFRSLAVADYAGLCVVLALICFLGLLWPVRRRSPSGIQG